MAWKRLGPQIVGQESDSEVIVADLQTGVYHSITGAGTVMWTGIDRGYSREQIIQMLESAYDATPQTLEQALIEFVDTLVDNDLIKLSGENSSIQELPKSQRQAVKHAFAAPAMATFRSADEALAKTGKKIKWSAASAQVVSDLVDGQLTVIDAAQGISCKVSGAGVSIWQCIERASSREEIIEALLADHQVSSEILAGEVDRFITELATLKLIHLSDQSLIGLKSETPSVAKELTKKAWLRPEVKIDLDRSAALRQIGQRRGWRIASPRIVAENIDNEVIAVDLKAGVYHSITGAGAVIWDGIGNGLVWKQLVEQLLGRFDTSPETAMAEVDDFIGKLVEFGLIYPNPNLNLEVETAVAPELSTAGEAPPAKEKFQPSTLIVYRDMEDVLRLDPIHDFDEYGWPARA